MRNRALMPAAMLVVLLTIGSAPTHAQFARPGELPPIDAKTRAMVVDSVTAVIDSVYVLGEPAKRIVAGLRDNLEAGSYDDLTDPAELARQLEMDAQAINNDNHFSILAMPPLDPEYAEEEEDPREVERRKRFDRVRNYGFQKVEVLPGGVGYLRLDSFAVGDEAAFDAAAAAMNFLANCSAVIIDLRQNGGGEPSMIRFLAGYLFAESTHLISWYERVNDHTVQSYSADWVPGRRFLDQPVYVLTSGRTASAAEEFTFDLKNLGRAAVVGDTTGGAGHTVSRSYFEFEGFRIRLSVPYGRAFNQENNEGWEGVGVIPDIAVPEGQALDAAHADALRKLREDEEDETFREAFDWMLRGVEARLEPVKLTSEEIAEYVGSYGPRQVFIDGATLYYRRGEQPRHGLEPMGKDLFSVEDYDYFRIAFERDDTGRIVKIVGLYLGRDPDEHARDAD